MKIISIPVVAITLFLAGCVQESSEQPEPGSTTIFADVVYTNGNIYTGVAGVVGYAIERKREKDEETLAIGVEYGYRFSEKWGIGAVFETLGEDVIRDTALVAPVSFHPHAGWRLFAGPGIEFTDKHNDWMLRFGAGYEFELSDHWTLAPEFVYDVIESGKRTYILALALGYTF
jgi:opacity protein-like surface antigen